MDCANTCPRCTARATCTSKEYEQYISGEILINTEKNLKSMFMQQ